MAVLTAPRRRTRLFKVMLDVHEATIGRPVVVPGAAAQETCTVHAAGGGHAFFAMIVQRRLVGFVVTECRLGTGVVGESCERRGGE